MISSLFVESYPWIKERIENKLNYKKKKWWNEYWEINSLFLCSNNKGTPCFCFVVVRTNEMDAQFPLDTVTSHKLQKTSPIWQCQFKLYVTFSIGGSDNLLIEKDTINWESIKVSWKLTNFRWKPCIMMVDWVKRGFNRISLSSSSKTWSKMCAWTDMHRSPKNSLSPILLWRAICQSLY